MSKTVKTPQANQRLTKKARLDPHSILKSSKAFKQVEDVQRGTKQKGKQKPVVAKSTEKHKSASTPLPPSTFNVVVGSYEKLLYGLQGSVTLSDAPSTSSPPFVFNLKPIFIFPAHVSCIKAVAASPSGGKWLATGSADEIIKVWDLRRRKEVGGLMHHEGLFTFYLSQFH